MIHNSHYFSKAFYSRAVPGIAFQTLSLIDVDSRCSWPVLMEQLAPPVKQKKGKKLTKNKVKRPRGRPKGSKNKNHRDVELNAERLQVQSMLKRLLALIGKSLQPTDFFYDGAFGNNAAAQMTRQVGLHLVSKLRCNSVLYFEKSARVIWFSTDLELEGESLVNYYRLRFQIDIYQPYCLHKFPFFS